MIGPHYQKIAEVQNRLNAHQLLQRIQSRSLNNPLTQIIDKMRKQFSQYETAYDDNIIDHHIHSVDRLLAFDGKLGPILSGLQKQNVLLRKQLSVLQSQLSNTVSICEQILTENNELKQIIINKNQDLERLIQTIGLNQSQQRGNLEEKIKLLQQQNNILITHMEMIKKQHQGYGEKFNQEKRETLLWKQKFEETKRHLNDTLQNEQDLSRRLSLQEHNLYNQRQKYFNIEQEFQAIKFENNQLKNQILIYKNQQQSFSIETLKSKLQEQYAGIIQEHRNLKKQRIDLIRQAQSNKLQKEESLDKLNNQDKYLTKLKTDFELTNRLLTEQKQKNATLQSSLARIEVKLDELKQQNEKLKLQNESLRNYSVQRQKGLLRQIEQLTSQRDKQAIQYDIRMREFKDKAKSLMDIKQSQLKNLTDTNIELRRILEGKGRN